MEDHSITTYLTKRKEEDKVSSRKNLMKDSTLRGKNIRNLLLLLYFIYLVIKYR